MTTPIFYWNAATVGSIAAFYPTTVPGFYELWIQDLNTKAVIKSANLPNNSLLHDGDSPLFRYALTSAQALTPGDNYAWWVGAVSTNGKKISWSSAAYFSADPVGDLTENFPMNGDVELTDLPSFSWGTPNAASATPIASYELWIRDNNTKAVLTIPNLPSTAAYYTLTSDQALKIGDSYVWSVGSVSASGKTIAWSLSNTFSVSASTGQPLLIGPNSQITTDMPGFTWESGSYSGTSPISSYELWITDNNTKKVETVTNLRLNHFWV